MHTEIQTALRFKHDIIIIIILVSVGEESRLF